MTIGPLTGTLSGNAMANKLIPLPFDGGINLLDDRRRIQDNELVKTKNIIPVQPGILGKRPAMGWVQQFTTGMGVGVPVSMMLSPFHNGAVDDIDGVWATVDVDNDAMWLNTMIPSATFSPLQVGGAELKPPSYASAQRILYAYPGYGASYAAYSLDIDDLDPTYAFKPWSFAGSGNDGIRPRMSVIYRNRFVYANFGPGYTSALLWADAFNPDTVGDNALASNGFYLTVGDEGGDEIVALVPITQTSVAAPTQEALLVLKQYSAYIITGEPTETGVTFSLEDVVVNRISYDVGCASMNTVVRTAYGVFWASHDDVWFFATGHTPVRIGSKIRPVLQVTNANKRYKWHAGYLNGFYRLALFGEESEQNVNSPCDEQYWLDLRGGAPQNHQEAKWWGPQVYSVTYKTDPVTVAQTIGTYCMAPEQRPEKSAALFGITQDGLSGGFPHSASLVKFDASSGPRDIGNQSIESVLDNYGHYTMELISKEYDFGDPMVQKIFQGLEFNSWVSQDSELTVKVDLDGGASYKVYTDDIPSRGFTADVDSADEVGTNLSREFQSKVILPDSDERVLGKTLQFHVYDEPGYTIIEGSNDQFYLAWGTDSSAISTGTVFSCSINPGFYASLTALSDAVVDAMEEALSAAGHFDSFSAVFNGSFKWEFTDLDGNGWAFASSNNGAVMPAGADDRSTYKVAAMFGYFPDDATLLEDNLAAANYAFSYGISDWQFGGFMLRLRPVNRRPVP